jgi:peptide deformylase
MTQDATPKTQILQLGNPDLRRQAQAVEDFTDPGLQELLTRLEQIMLDAKGVGIAAPQLGESSQIIIIASRPTPRYPNAPLMDALVMINPHFTHLDSELVKDWEGCLSVPGIRALVPRHRNIQVDFQDRLGQAQKLVLTDFPARVFQHEFDHLQGLVYLDRVETNRDIFSEAEFFKLIATTELSA